MIGENSASTISGHVTKLLLSKDWMKKMIRRKYETKLNFYLLVIKVIYSFHLHPILVYRAVAS